MNYLIGLDIGTSSVKGVLMTTEGQVVHSAKGVFDYKRKETGEVELNPEAFLETCLGTIRELASAENQILGICASSASGNLLLLDKEMQPLTNIISWQDKRVSTEAKEVLGEMNDLDFYRQIGWPFGYQAFPLAQLCYIKRQEPELIGKCGMAAMSTEYLYYALTGKWGISTSAGTTYFLIDQEKGTYIQNLLDTLGIEESMMPPILPCGFVLGTVTKEIADKCGLSENTPVILGSFDHPSAARGVGVLEEGEMLLSCGTSWVAFFPMKDREKALGARMLIDPFLTKEKTYGCMVSVASVSERIHLYVNRYIGEGEEAFAELSALARQSEPGAGGLRLNLREEPDDSVILSFPKKHIARAIMEGVVELLKVRLEGLKEKGISAERAVMVGGPSEDPYWIKLIEEMLSISVRVEGGSYAGAVGAAILAGIGTAVYKDEKDAKEKIYAEHTSK